MSKIFHPWVLHLNTMHHTKDKTVLKRGPNSITATVDDLQEIKNVIKINFNAIPSYAR